MVSREKEDADEYLAHKKAALLSLDKIKRNTDSYFENLVLQGDYKGKKREDFYQIFIEPDKLDGEKISLQNFLGRYYCTKRHKSALRGSSPEFLNSYFWSGDEEKSSNVLDVNREFSDIEHGFVYAFFEPPYNV